MKLSRQRKLISRACLMAAASLIAAVPTVRAANVFFDQNAATIGTSGTGAWDATSAFWVNAGTGTSIPGNVAGAAYTFTNADTAYFIGQSGTITGSASVTASGGASGQAVITTTNTTGLAVGMTVTGTGIPAGATITAITANTNFTISANLTATAAGTVVAAQLVTLNGLYDSTQGMTIAGAQTLTLAGSTPTITNTGSAVTTISANVAGTAGFTKAGTGILALSGTNTISGNINLQQGVISLNSATALGTASLTIGGSGYAVGLDGAGTTLTSTGAMTVGGDFTFIGTNSLNTGTGAVTLAANRTVQVGMNAQTTGALTIGGIISGAGALTKTGPGSLTLSGANSYTGGTILNAGSLTLSGANTTSGATTVNGGRLTLGNAAALGTGALNLTGGLIDATAATTLTSTGAINITGDFVYGGTFSLTTAAGANIVVAANSTIKTYGTGATSSLTLGGVISGTGFGLTKTGTGALVASNANTFDGGVTLVDGRLSVGNSAALGTGALTFAGGSLDASAAGLTLANALTLSADAGFLGSNALTLSGNASLGAGNRAVNAAASALTLSGVVSGNAFTKTGLGTVVLSGTNTYTGGTTVRQGTLTAGNTAAFGTGAILVASTGTLDLSTQTITNTVNLFGGTLAATGGSTNLSTSLLGAGSFGTISGIISAGSALNQSAWLTPLNAARTLTLTGANTFTTGANLSAGTLALGNNAALGTGALTATGGLLDATTAITIANATTISGAVGFTGSAPLTTSGTVTLGGTTSLFSAAGVVSNTASGGAVGTATITTASTTGLVVGQTVSGTGIPAGSVITAITPGVSYTISNNLTAIASGTVSAYNALTINGILSGSSVLTLNGPGLTVLGGANTNSGGDVIASGTTRLTNASGLGTSAATVKGNSSVAGTLDIGGKAVTNALTFSGGSLTDSTGGAGSVTGNVLVDNLTAAASISAKISGTATLTKNNLGSLALNGFTDFSGGTTINGGAVTAGANQAIGTGSVTINRGSLDLVTFTAPNTFNLAGGTLAASGAANLPVTQIGANSFGVISGILSGAGSLTVNTSNLLTLSGVNTFTGTSNTLTAGTLNINNAAALGAATATWTFNGGSIDNTTGAAITTGANPLTLGGNVTFTGTQSLNLAGTVALSANRSLSILQNTLTLSGIVSGATYSLTKNGFGNLTLSAANTYSGGTVINAGVATAGNAAAFGTGAITVNGINAQITNVFSGGTVGNGSSGMGGTLDLAALTPTNSIVLAGGALTGTAIDPSKISGYGFIQGAMTGAGVLTVNTAGALTIYAGQAFTGGTTLTAGTLNLMNATSAGTGTLTLNGGTLDNSTTAGITVANAVTLGGNIIFQGTQSLQLSGAMTIGANRTITSNAGWQGIGSGNTTLTGTLTKAGAGWLALSGLANSGAGGINVTGGTLDTNTGAITAPSFGTGAVAISAGANVLIRSTPAADNTVPNAFSGAGNLYVSPRGAGTATLTLSGDLSAFTGLLSVGAANGNGKVALPSTLNSTALVRLESGATFWTSATGTIANTIQLLGGTTGEAYGQIRNDSATFSGSLILLANSTIGNQSTNASAFSGPIIGNFALTRQGTAANTVTLSGNNTFTGGLTISGAGTTAFGNANAAGSGTLNLSITGAAGTIASGLGVFNLGGLAGATGSSLAFVGTDSARIGSNNASTTFAGVVSGAGSVAKVGTGTLTLQGLNTFTGGLNINAGGVTLDFTTNASNVLASTGSVNLNGGTLTLLGKSAATDTQTITGAGLLTVATGGSKLVFNQNSATGLLLSVGNLARNVGATLDISQTGTPSAANGLVIANANVNGILGAWATVGGTDWAVANVGTGVSAFAGYTALVTDGTNLTAANSLLTDGATTTSVAGLSANSLKITTTQSGQVLDLGGQQLTLTSGGLLFIGADSYALRSVAAGASITPAAAQELIVQQAGTGVLTLNIPVVDNGAAVSFVKAGTGELVLGVANTFTGNTFINGGTLTIASESALGAVPAVNAAANVSISGATLKSTADVSLDAKRGVVVGASGATFAPTNSTLTLAGPISGAGSVTLTGTANGKLVLGSANTYTGATSVTAGTLVLNNSGSLGTSGALTLSGGSVGFGAGVTTLSLTNLSTSAGTITLSTTEATPVAVALSVNAAAGVPATFAGNFAGLGSLALSGNGSVFTLSGANTLVGGVSLAANSGLNVNSTGALGTGTFSLGAGSAVLGFTTTLDNTSTNVVTVSSNPALTLAGDFTFTGTRNLNLGTGAVTLSGNRIVTMNGAPVTYAGEGGILTIGGNVSGTAALTLAGTGRLVLNGTNTFTGNVTINGGTLVVSSDAGLGNSANAIVLNGATSATSNSSTIQPAGLGVAGTFSSTRAITLSLIHI
jgi:fibronectin-binding autotransporter adhesin